PYHRHLHSFPTRRSSDLRKRRPNQFSLDEPVEGDTDLMPRELEDWGPSPEQGYAQAELQGILSEFIEQLDPEFRIVLVLRDLEEDRKSTRLNSSHVSISY